MSMFTYDCVLRRRGAQLRERRMFVRIRLSRMVGQSVVWWRCHDESSRCEPQVGFRSVEVRDRQLLVNNRRIMIRGAYSVCLGRFINVQSR